MARRIGCSVIIFLIATTSLHSITYAGRYNMRQVNSATINLIENFEGFKSLPYKDGAGISTVGIGHQIMDGDNFIYPMTRDFAQMLLQQDIATKAAIYVEQYVTVSLNDNQFGALASFCFNEGCERLQGSTLLRKLNAGDYDGAADEFQRWIYVNDEIEEGLVRRRDAEKALFLTPCETTVATSE